LRSDQSDGTCPRYRHRYRQIFWLQALATELERARNEYFLRYFKLLTSDGGRARTNANGDVAGELGFEPRLTESESAVLPLNYSPPIRSRSQWLARSVLQIQVVGFANSGSPGRYMRAACSLSS